MMFNGMGLGTTGFQMLVPGILPVLSSLIPELTFGQPDRINFPPRAQVLDTVPICSNQFSAVSPQFCVQLLKYRCFWDLPPPG